VKTARHSAGEITTKEENPMSRIPSHTVEDAPELSRSLLEGVIQFSPTGKPLNLHAQMAHSPALLAAYTSIRKTTAELGTLDQPLRAALMLATAAAIGNDYTIAVTSRLALGAGWQESQVQSLRAGEAVGDEKTDSLINVVREAAARAGHVSDATWNEAQQAGWNDEQLAETFAYLALAVFTAYFLNYAQTDIDLPISPQAA
jgi:alkylhydroperoxidase/carboxymuconolactone decarboxylase family protein YurZ